MIWTVWICLVGAMVAHAAYSRSRRRSQTVQLPPVDRLRQIANRAAWIREQQEAMAAECCLACCVDPNSESIERDWCEEIVYHGTSPDVVINRLANAPDEAL